MVQDRNTNYKRPNYRPPNDFLNNVMFSSNPFSSAKPPSKPPSSGSGQSKPSPNVKIKLIERLFNGEKKRVDAGIRKKTERTAVESVQGKTVIQRDKGCVVCGASFMKDTHNFQIHHVDGDPSNTSVTNLKLLCIKHHHEIHTKVKLDIAEYKNKKGKQTR